MTPKKVYLAGPDVFLANARAVGERKRAMCRDFGFEGLFPLDNEEGVAGDAASIFRANCSLMRRADIGVFNLTPFRGPSADAGTIFELGFLFSQGKPVYGYTAATGAYRERVQGVGGGHAGRHGEPRDRDGYTVENFGLPDNLMVARAIEDSGGVIVAAREGAAHQDDAPLAAFQAFLACLEQIRQRVCQGAM